MIVENRTYLSTCGNLCNCNSPKPCAGCVRRYQTGELRFFNSPNLRTAEDVIQLYKQNTQEYITHKATTLYGVDEFHFYVSEFTVTPYDPEMGFMCPKLN